MMTAKTTSVPPCDVTLLISAMACALVAIAPVTAATQLGEEQVTRSWLDHYYANYTAMSAAPTGPAMEMWLAHYAPYAFFEDPTIAQSGLGLEQIRKPYVDAFTGPMGPVRWTILRCVTSGEWAAVEGWVDGTHHNKPVRARFTTWLKVRHGKIVHQIDFVDYDALRRQAPIESEVSRDAGKPAARSGARVGDTSRARRVADEFYRRYDAMALLHSPAGVARFVELLTEDFTLEDPTAALVHKSREERHGTLKETMTTGDFGPIHWEVDRSITDGEWVAVEGVFRGVFRTHPFATRFSTWLRVRGDKIAHQIDYVDYTTFRTLTSPPRKP